MQARMGTGRSAGGTERVNVVVVAIAALAVAVGQPGTALAQQAAEDTAAAAEDTAAGAEEATGRVGAFTFAILGGEGEGAETRLLVAPDTASTLNEGARLFFRCRGGRGEIYVAVTDGNLGSAREGAGGQWRFDRRPWSELVRWGANDEGTAAFVPPRLYDTFVRRGREAEVVEVRIVNLAGVRKRFVFPLGGFSEGVDRLGCFGT